MFYNKSMLIDMDKIYYQNNFKKTMIDVYTNLTNHMPDDGIQVLMFNHTKLDTWVDMLDIVRESGLYMTAVYPVEIEKRMKQNNGNYNCVMLMICRKRNFDYDLISKEELLSLMSELEEDLVISMEDMDLNDTDGKIFNWLKAIKILSAYTWDFNVKEILKEISEKPTPKAIENGKKLVEIFDRIVEK